jgi:hypothetical protein
MHLFIHKYLIFKIKPPKIIITQQIDKGCVILDKIFFNILNVKKHK